MKDCKTNPSELTAAEWERETATLGKDFERAELDSRTFVYEKLARVYSLSSIVPERSDIQTRLKVLAEKADLSFDEPNLVHAHVLRYAVGKLSRQRISDFAAVLTEAKRIDVRPEGFVAWVRKKGTEGILKARRKRLKQEKERETSEKTVSSPPTVTSTSGSDEKIIFPQPAQLKLEPGTYVAVIVADSQKIEVVRHSRDRLALRAAMKALNDADAREEEVKSRVAAGKAKRANSNRQHTDMAA